MAQFTRVRASRRANAEALVNLRKRRAWYVDITVTAANVVPGAGAKKENVTAGATITAGEVVYKAADGDYELADASALATSRVAGIALNGASSGQPLTILTEGNITIGATVAVGTIYVLSAAAGKIAPDADIVTSEFITILGVATTTGIIKVKINASEVAHA